MTIIHKTGDIFTTDLAAVVHGVNIRGVMGSGIAKTVRQYYPDVYTAYRDYCKAGKLEAGGMFPFFGFSPHGASADRWIINAASQDEPGPSARYEWLEESLEKTFRWLEQAQIKGVAIPRIGAGIGGLEWDKVLVIIEKIASEYPGIEVEVWTYEG